MDASLIARLAVEALYLVLWVSAPALGVSLLVGLVIGIAQAATQVQESTLAFVPKLVAVALCLAVFGGAIGGELVRFTRSTFEQAARVGR